MKLFRSIDKKFRDIGFCLISSNENGIYYLRFRCGIPSQQLFIHTYGEAGYIIESVSEDDKLHHIPLTAYELNLIHKKITIMEGKKLFKDVCLSLKEFKR